MMMMLSTETELSKTSAGVHRFLDLHLRFVFQIDIARHRDLAKGSFSFLIFSRIAGLAAEGQ